MLKFSEEEMASRKFFKGSGCDNCNNTGYKGRIGLFELMIMNDDLRGERSEYDVIPPSRRR
jgi:type IV pilus assembly protein PilB